jgi:hypothetical protein
MFEYHFSFTDFFKKDGNVIKQFDRELNDEEVNRELGIVIKENNAFSAVLESVSENKQININEWFKNRHEEIYKKVRMEEELEFNNLLNLMKE